MRLLEKLNYQIVHFPEWCKKNIETLNNTAISNNLNKYYTEIGTNLANKNRQ